MIDLAIFSDAVQSLLDKDAAPSSFDSSQWAAVSQDIKARSFFISKVESARFLDKIQGYLFDYLVGTRDVVLLPDGTTTEAVRVASRADFTRLMRDLMISEGLVDESDLEQLNQRDVRKLGSESRINLVFDNAVRSAHGYGKYKQSMSPAVLRRWPAARFVRERGVNEPRPRHLASEGEVRLITDTSWWGSYQNDPAIGGFGVPWPPYGHRSGMTQEPVSREEASGLGINPPDSSPPVRRYNDDLSISTRRMSASTRKALIDELRGGPGSVSIEDAGDKILLLRNNP